VHVTLQKNSFVQEFICCIEKQIYRFRKKGLEFGHRYWQCLQKVIRVDCMHVCSMHYYWTSNKKAFWVDEWHSFPLKAFWELGSRGLCPFQQAASLSYQSIIIQTRAAANTACDKASSGLKRISVQSCRFVHQQQCQETPKALITGTQ